MTTPIPAVGSLWRHTLSRKLVQVVELPIYEGEQCVGVLGALGGPYRWGLVNFLRAFEPVSKQETQ